MANSFNPVHPIVNLVHALSRLSNHEDQVDKQSATQRTIFKNLGGGSLFHGSNNRELAAWLMQRALGAQKMKH